MTNKERKEVRYLRRRAKRELKKQEQVLNFKQVFITKNLYSSYKKCIKGVKRKASTQKYIDNATLFNYRSKDKLKRGKFRTDGFYEFDVRERGKCRHIKSVTINERVVQRCLCDYSLVPILGRTLIYDNGASMENKGYHFAIRRIVRYLKNHYRVYGNQGYVLLYDFSKFFDNLSHKLMARILRKEYTDKWLLGLITHFIKAFGDSGMGLGSQISQILAVASANKLDHYVKEVLKIKGYGRYMDDGILIHPSKIYLQKCLEHIKAICDELEIKLNLKKTQIVKISHGFTWLKCRFYLLESGKVVQKIYKRSVSKMRQKVRKFKKLYDTKEMTLEHIRDGVQSWISYALNFNACITVRNIVEQIKNIFGVEDARKILGIKRLKRNRVKRKMRYIQYYAFAA